MRKRLLSANSYRRTRGRKRKTRLPFGTEFFAASENRAEASDRTCVPMESGDAEREAVHAAVQHRPEQVRHDGAGRAGVDQSAARSDVVLPKVLSRGHLRLLRDEHRRRQYPGLHNVNPSVRLVIFFTHIHIHTHVFSTTFQTDPDDRKF